MGAWVGIWWMGAWVGIWLSLNIDDMAFILRRAVYFSNSFSQKFMSPEFFIFATITFLKSLLVSIQSLDTV